MAKSTLRLEARKLRRRGISVKRIAEYLEVSKSTASIWVRDIILNIDQLEALKQAAIKGSERGRLKSALLQKEKRLKLILSSKREGTEKLSRLTEREFLIAGIALYWGEGSRKSRELEFCNSDPKMIKFLIEWLRINFHVEANELKCCIGINELHRKREDRVKQFWSEITGIPLSQFLKTSFKKAKNKKVYENFNDHYGTLSVSVLKSAKYYYQIIGLIEGLNEAGMKLVFQDVS